MQFDLNTLWAEVRAAVQFPRHSARRVLDRNLAQKTAALALLVVAILTALVSAFIGMIGQTTGAEGMMFALTPLNWALIQVSGMFFAAFVITVAGQWFGGTGTLAGSMAVLAWMQFILLLVQLAQLVITLLLPIFAQPIFLAVAMLSIWLMVNFVAELHGFSSLIKVFFGILGTGFALIMALSLLMAPFMRGMGG
jgi:hypothetical protein